MDAEVVLGIEKANINYAQGCIDDDIKYNSRIAAALRQLYEHQDPIPEEANTGIKDLFIEAYTARLTETDQRFVPCTLPVNKLNETDKAKVRQRYQRKGAAPSAPMLLQAPKVWQRYQRICTKGTNATNPPSIVTKPSLSLIPRRLLPAPLLRNVPISVFVKALRAHSSAPVLGAKL